WPAPPALRLRNDPCDDYVAARSVQLGGGHNRAYLGRKRDVVSKPPVAETRCCALVRCRCARLGRNCPLFRFRRRHGRGVGKGPHAYRTDADLEVAPGPTYKPVDRDGLRELLAGAATGENVRCFTQSSHQHSAQWLPRGLFESWMDRDLFHCSFVGDWIYEDHCGHSSKLANGFVVSWIFSVYAVLLLY